MRITFLERCRRAAVFFSGLSLICGSQAFADDGCATAASCGTAQDAACCDKLFEETGEKLSKQLGSLVDRCCAPKNDCGAADDCSVIECVNAPMLIRSTPLPAIMAAFCR